MMTRFTNKVLTIVFSLLILTGAQQAFAQDGGDGTVNTVVTTHSKDGIFSSTASYTFDVTSTYNTPQKGRVKYLVTTEAGKHLKSDSVRVDIGKRGSASYNFDIHNLPSGFYKISFMINVTDYDDTTRKAFGIRPEELRSQYGKPADFESFWHNSKLELDKVKPEYKVTEMPDSSKDGRRVFLVEMKSLGGLTIRGWLTEPKSKNKNKKFVVMLGLPGYQVDLKPLYGTDPDVAIFSLNIRGQGNSRDVINVRRETYITLGIEDKNKYVLRGAIMDCVRAVDFICSRPELRHDNIIAVGGSLGGFLALATSSVDKRISFCSAANPILSDVRNLVDQVDWPFIDIRRYVNTRPGLTFDKVLNNLDYFDAKNFASDLECPTLVGLGLVDNIAPPNTVYTLYNGIRSQKHLIVFRDLGHEIGKKYEVYEGRWMRDTFALF
ncbi:acetylxylan esterase [Mucilaginibacter sp. BJC16-A38]|uniref:acetylxylan esterase n=1 Tax=Mucilaginibacter phenanthrenivorans TaxID=1234842 RepID=UPI0021583524|nr:acetylxylan esterase [Mucilaginibacter phenanthrenivorans]MCR8561803.1 acetylxylan esterase [Mucilaginibacter phenanthrenivorans]